MTMVYLQLNCPGQPDYFWFFTGKLYTFGFPKLQKRYMKRIVLTALIAAFTVAFVNAQKTSGTAKPVKTTTVKEEAKQASENDGLTTEQKENAKAQKGAQQKEIQEARKQGASEEKIQAAQQKQAKPAPVKEQKSKVTADKKDEIQADQAAERKTSFAAGSQEEIKAKIKAIYQDETLTEEQKKQKAEELVALLKEDKTKNSSESKEAKPKKLLSEKKAVQ